MKDVLLFILHIKGVSKVLKVQEIRELIKLLDQSTLSELTYEEDDCKIKLKKGAVAGQVVTEAVPQQTPVQAVPTPVQEAAPAEPKAVKQEEKPAAAPSADINDENLHKIESPMVGTFYSAPSPDEADYVNIGDKVTEDKVICIVEAMKLFNEIEAEVKGEVVEVLVENGQLVEYGQPLFLVKPE